MKNYFLLILSFAICSNAHSQELKYIVPNSGANKELFKEPADSSELTVFATIKTNLINSKNQYYNPCYTILTGTGAYPKNAYYNHFLKELDSIPHSGSYDTYFNKIVHSDLPLRNEYGEDSLIQYEDGNLVIVYPAPTIEPILLTDLYQISLSYRKGSKGTNNITIGFFLETRQLFWISYEDLKKILVLPAHQEWLNKVISPSTTRYLYYNSDWWQD